MAYSIKRAKEHLDNKNYAWAVWGAAGVVMEKLYSNLGAKVRVIRRSADEPRPTRMTRRAIDDVRTQGLITDLDRTEALWLLRFYYNLKEIDTPSLTDTQRAIAIAEIFSRKL